MSPAARRPAKPASQLNWVSLLQFIGSAFGLIGFAGIAVSGLSVALLSLFGFSPQESDGILLASAGALWAGILLLPSLAYSLAKLIGRPLREPQLRGYARWLGPALFLLLVLAILGGAGVLQLGLGAALAPFHVAAATLSVASLAWLGLRKLGLHSRAGWGAFASGLTGVPALAIMLELAVGVVLLALGMVYVTTNPSLAGQLEHIESVLTHIQDPQEALSLLSDFINDPFLLSLLLSNFALFVPLIEELLKPLAVWLLVWRRPLSNAQGFAIGLLGGAGFALMENLFAADTVDWTATTVLRFGATAFHIATAGLMGWAIVRAKKEGRYFGVFLVYGLNILLHGLWNGVVITMGFAPELLQDVYPVAGLALMGISLGSIGVLIVMNKQLQSAAADTPAPANRASAKRS